MRKKYINMSSIVLIFVVMLGIYTLIYNTYIKNNSIETINTKNENINYDENLYISTVYTNPDLDINEDVILKFYATDYNHTAYIDDDYSEVFKIKLNLNGKVIEFVKNVGESTINLGKKTEGEYEYTIQAIDKYGRKSPELYGEFRVDDKKKKDREIRNNTYHVDNQDLLDYEISMDDDSSKSHKTKIGLQNLINDLTKQGVRKCILPKGIYRIDSEYEEADGVQRVKNVITIPSNFILDLNGSVLKQDTTNPLQVKGCMMAIESAYDAHVTNGIIEGDYGQRDLSPLPNGNQSAEGVGFGVISGDSKYSSFNNLTVRKISGYALSVGLGINSKHAFSTWKGLNNWKSVDIDEDGKEISSSNKFTSNYYDLSEYLGIDTLRTGKYLGYQFSQDGDDWVGATCC